jgi:hypothetical protein
LIFLLLFLKHCLKDVGKHEASVVISLHLVPALLVLSNKLLEKFPINEHFEITILILNHFLCYLRVVFD